MKLADLFEVDAEKLKAAMAKNKKAVDRDEAWRKKFYKKGKTKHPRLTPKDEFGKK